MLRSAFFRILFFFALANYCCFIQIATASSESVVVKKNRKTPDNTMSLSEAYQLAQKNDAALASARAIYKSRSEAIPEARAALLPQISAVANTAYNSNNAVKAPVIYGNKKTHWNTHGWSATLSQSIFDLSKWFDVSVASTEDSVAKLSLAIQEQQLIYDVAEKYFAVLKAHSDEAAAKANLRAVQKQLNQTEERFKVGMVANTDVQEAKASYDTAKVSVIQASNAITVAEENLSLLTNEPDRKVYRLNQLMPVKGPAPLVVTSWETQAMQHNLNVRQAKVSVQLSHKQLHSALAKHLPTVSGSVTYQHSTNNSAVQIAQNGGVNNGVTAGLSLIIPVFSGGAISAKSNAVRYTLESSQKKEEQAIREARVSARNGFNTVNTDVASVNAWCQGIISAKSSMKATKSGYAVGTRTIIDVLNSQSVLYNAEKQYLDARYNFILNTLKLKQVAGRLSPDDLEILSGWMTPAQSLSGGLTPYCK